MLLGKFFICVLLSWIYAAPVNGDEDDDVTTAVPEDDPLPDETRRTPLIPGLIKKSPGVGSPVIVTENRPVIYHKNARSYDSEIELCENADFLVKILNIILPLLAKNLSGRAKTTYVLQILREIINSSPNTIQDQEVIFKINDLLQTLQKYDLDLGNPPVDNAIRGINSKISFNFEIPTFTNPDCTAELLAIIKVVQDSILRLVNNPVCKNKVITATLPVYDINSILKNPFQHLIMQNLISSTESPSIQPVDIYYTQQNLPQYLNVPDLNIFNVPDTNNPITIPSENLVVPFKEINWPTITDDSMEIIKTPKETAVFENQVPIDYSLSPVPELVKFPNPLPDNLPYWNIKDFVKPDYPQFDVEINPDHEYIDEEEYSPNLVYSTPLPFAAGAESTYDEELPYWIPNTPPLHDDSELLNPVHLSYIVPEYDETKYHDFSPAFVDDIPVILLSTTTKPAYYVEDKPQDVYFKQPKKISPDNPYQYDASPTSVPVINGIPILPNEDSPTSEERKPDNPHVENDIDEPNYQNPVSNSPLAPYPDDYYNIIYPNPLLLYKQDKEPAKLYPMEIYPTVPDHNNYFEETTDRLEKYPEVVKYLTNEIEDGNPPEYPKDTQKQPWWYPIYDIQPKYPLITDFQPTEAEFDILPKTDEIPNKENKFPWPQINDKFIDIPESELQPNKLPKIYPSYPEDEQKNPWYFIKDDIENIQPVYPINQEVELVTPSTESLYNINVPEKNKSPDWRQIYLNIINEPLSPQQPDVTLLRPPTGVDTDVIIPKDIKNYINRLPWYKAEDDQVFVPPPHYEETYSIIKPVDLNYVYTDINDDNIYPNTNNEYAWLPKYDINQNLPNNFLPSDIQKPVDLNPVQPYDKPVKENNKYSWLPMFISEQKQNPDYNNLRPEEYVQQMFVVPTKVTKPEDEIVLPQGDNYYPILDVVQKPQPNYSLAPKQSTIDNVFRPLKPTQPESEIAVPTEDLYYPIFDVDQYLQPNYPLKPAQDNIEENIFPFKQNKPEYEVLFPKEENYYPILDIDQYPQPIYPLQPEKDNVANIFEYPSQETQSEYDFGVPNEKKNPDVANILPEGWQPTYETIYNIPPDNSVPYNEYDIVTTPQIDKQFLLLVKDNIDIIEHKVPNVHSNANIHQSLDKLKELTSHAKITIDDYATIVNQYENLIEYIKHLNINNELLKELLLSMTNVQKSIHHTGKSNVIELTYLVKRPTPLVYQPYYYVKYRLPYISFLKRVEQLLVEKPYLNNDPANLYKELIALSNVAETSPDLNYYGKEDILKLTFSNGTLMAAKVVKGDDVDMYGELDLLKEINSDTTLDDAIKLIKNARDEEITIEENTSGNSPYTINIQVNENQNLQPSTKLTAREVINNILKKVYSLRSPNQIERSKYLLNAENSDELLNPGDENSLRLNQDSFGEAKVDPTQSEELDGDDMTFLSGLRDDFFQVKQNTVSSESPTSNVVENQETNPVLGAKLLDATIKAHESKTVDDQKPVLDYDYSPLSPENDLDDNFDFPNQNAETLAAVPTPDKLQGYISVAQGGVLSPKVNEADGNLNEKSNIVELSPDTSLGAQLFQATIEAHNKVDPQPVQIMSAPVKYSYNSPDTINYVKFNQADGNNNLSNLNQQYNIVGNPILIRQRFTGPPIVKQSTYTYKMPGKIQYYRSDDQLEDIQSQTEAQPKDN